MRPTTRARYLLWLLSIGAAVGVSYLLAGPVPPGGFEADTSEPDDALGVNLSILLSEQLGLEVDPWSITLTDAPDAPPSWGQGRAAWFAARPVGTEDAEGPAEIWRVRVRASANGVPIALSEPANLTRTPDGDEVLLDADDHRALYAIRVTGRFHSVVLLDFSAAQTPGVGAEPPLATQAVAALSAKQTYDTWRGPRRHDVLLLDPAPFVTGRLVERGAEVSLGEDAVVAIDIARRTVSPPSLAEMLPSAAPEFEALGLAADALRRSPLVGVTQVVAVESLVFAVQDWLRRQQHRLFPTTADAVPVPAQGRAPEEPIGWPPPAIRVERGKGLPGEGRWTQAGAVEAPRGIPTPPVAQTFVRVDPDRPYEQVHLFAFDMRRLGLHFVSGTRHPRSTTGARGTGRIPDRHRARLVAAFNGGFKVEHGMFGAVESGRTIVPPVAGYATVATDDSGGVGLGVWDRGDRMPPPWVSLRQNLAPLIADGVVNPTRSRNWGEVVSELDDARTPRSALGVTGAGVLLYGWGRAVSAEHLGEALRRAGVVFAVHLDMNPGHTGLELYSGPSRRRHAIPGVPEMDYRRERWLGVDARDFFYVVHQDPPGLGMPADVPAARRAGGEGTWQPVRSMVDLASPWPPMLTGYFTPAMVGGNTVVRMVAIDVSLMRPHIAPGLGEPRPDTGVRPLQELKLEGPPTFWVDIGVGSEASGYGLVAARHVVRPPRTGAMTLAVAADGEVFVGSWERDPGLEGEGWAEIRQGDALLSRGKAVEAEAPDGLPAVGAGLDGVGRLVLATADDGDRAALARAMLGAGVRTAVVLSESATIATGAWRFLHFYESKLFETHRPGAPLRPSALGPTVGSALVFERRSAPPRAEALRGFGIRVGVPGG